MVDDEPAFAAQLGPKVTAEVNRIARAMCNASSREDDGALCSCPWDGGSCCAFGLFGDLAHAAWLTMHAAQPDVSRQFRRE